MYGGRSETNGILIDESWCNFFKATNSKVGVSLDGPARLNDLNRLTRSNATTTDRTLSGIRALKRSGIDFYVLTVLSRNSLSAAHELYAFYADEGIENVAFNVEEIEAGHSTSSLMFEGVENLFGEFLREFWELNRRHKKLRRVREFNGMHSCLTANPDYRIRNMLTEPFSIISIDSFGNFSTFSPELLESSSDSHGNFIFGNVWFDELHRALDGEPLTRVLSDINGGVDACRTQCEYFPVCGGGDPANKLFENGSFVSTETLSYRLSIKAVASFMIGVVEDPRLPRSSPADEASRSV